MQINQFFIRCRLTKRNTRKQYKDTKINIDGFRNSFYVTLTLKWRLEKRCFIQMCDTPVRI